MYLLPQLTKIIGFKPYFIFVNLSWVKQYAVFFIFRIVHNQHVIINYSGIDKYLSLNNTSHAGLRLASICYEEMYSVQR
jgi:hypothetical protein